MFVGLTIQDARQTAAGKAGIGMIRELGPNGTSHNGIPETGRSFLLVVGGAVVTASMCWSPTPPHFSPFAGEKNGCNLEAVGLSVRTSSLMFGSLAEHTPASWPCARRP